MTKSLTIIISLVLLVSLGIFSAIQVKKLNKDLNNNIVKFPKKCKIIPHIGWNELYPSNDKKAWMLIKKSGCDKFYVGDAKISEKHCNFFVNDGKAKASDIEKLINKNPILDDIEVLA